MGKPFSILGDSSSTFLGFLPEHYSPYYPNPEAVPDVLRVEDTWWHQLVEMSGMTLAVNNSYSGSTVCTKVRDGHPAWNSYVRRAEAADFGNPDYILVFGGTNDSWLEREPGEPVYEGRTEAQLEQVLPAFCHVLETLAARYPQTKPVAVINTGLDPRITQGMREAAAHYGAATVALENIDKTNGRPTALGMTQIARQVVAALNTGDKNMPDVVALGELLIDFTNVSADPEGYPTMAAHPGGAPANFLAALTKFGVKTALLGKVGNDTFGKLLAGTLQKAGIETRGLVMADDVFTTLAFVTLDETGNREFAFARKPGADTKLSFAEIDLSLIDSAKVFHFGTLSLTDEPARSATCKAVAYAKEKGKLITYDPNLRKPLWNDLEEAKRQLIWGLSQADVVKISDEEVEFLFGLGVEEGAAYIMEQFGVKLVFVTCGAEGCFFRNKNGSGHVPSLSGIRVVDTTGAGDIFGGSALSQILRFGVAPEKLTRRELEAVTHFACTAAGLSTTKPGGISSVPEYNEVLNRM